MVNRNTRIIAVIAALAGLATIPPTAALGQEKISIGERVTLQSKVLGESRALLVSLPDDYGQRQDRYPVVYLLDGEVHFDHVSGLARFLAWSAQAPPMIVVGVVNTDRMRDFSLKPYPGQPTSGGAARFLEFLGTELVPWVDRTYRTTPRRMLVGHSLCGSFAVHAMLARPDLFDGYTAISPGEPTQDPNVVALWGEAARTLPALSGSKKTLFLTVGDGEAPSQLTYVSRLAEVFRLRAASTVRWTYAVTAGDNHSTLVHKSIDQALLDAYAGWRIPDDALLKGLEALKTHYAGFGFDPPLERDVNGNGYRLLELNETQKAIEMFAYNVQMRPRSANVYDSLAEAYERNGQMDLAAKNYATAVRTAEETNDSRLELFRQNAERFRSAAAKAKENATTIARPAGALRPNLVALAVADLDASVRWYVETLGFEVSSRRQSPDSTARGAFLARDGFRLEIVERRDGISIGDRLPGVSPDRVRGIKKITFDVGSLDAWAAWLKSRNVKMVVDVQPATTVNGKWLIVQDPEGNWVQLIEAVR